MARPRPAGASRGTQACSADSTASASAVAQASNASGVTGAPSRFARSCRAGASAASGGRAQRSCSGPGLQVPFFQDPDLLLDGLEARAAEGEQLRAAAIARQHAIEGQLTGLHGGDEGVELG